jgi:hypothetical protein
MRVLIAAVAAALSAATACSDAHQAPSQNASFITRAESVCTRAKKQLDALPKFPFKGFDPMHPDPRLLPKIGRFFTGAGNELPITRALERQLRALGNPPAAREDWRDVVATFHDFVVVFQREDAAALNANVDGWVKAVRENRRLPDRLRVATKAFGAKRCAIFN